MKRKRGPIDPFCTQYPRAKNGVGLIVTGGIAPNRQGKLSPFAAKLTNPLEVRVHRHVTEAVHQHEGAKIAMQILHAGRYAYHPWLVAPSAIKVRFRCVVLRGRRRGFNLFDRSSCPLPPSFQAPISRFPPRALTEKEIEATIQDYAHCASLAKEAG